MAGPHWFTTGWSSTHELSLSQTHPASCTEGGTFSCFDCSLQYIRRRTQRCPTFLLSAGAGGGLVEGAKQPFIRPLIVWLMWRNSMWCVSWLFMEDLDQEFCDGEKAVKRFGDQNQQFFAQMPWSNIYSVYIFSSTKTWLLESSWIYTVIYTRWLIMYWITMHTPLICTTDMDVTSTRSVILGGKTITGMRLHQASLLVACADLATILVSE